eukprot:14674770-Alexandrium_andersonii.AAC.1
MPVQLDMKNPPRRERPGPVPIRAPSGRSSSVYMVKCPAACGNIITLKCRPAKEGTSWPKVKCGSCRAHKRCSTA